MKYLVIMENREAYRMQTIETESATKAQRQAKEMAAKREMRLIETKLYRNNHKNGEMK